MAGTRLFTLAAAGTAVAIALFILGVANILFVDVGIFVEGAAFALGLAGIAAAAADAARHMNDRPRRTAAHR